MAHLLAEPAIPGWPAYGEARRTRRFGGPGDGTVVEDPDAERRGLWPER